MIRRTVSLGFAQHGLGRWAFLRNEYERASVLHVWYINSKLSQSWQSSGQICSWLIGRYSHYDATTVYLMQVSTQVNGCRRRIKGVETAWLLQRTSERLDQEYVDSTTTRRWAVIRGFPDSNVVQLDEARQVEVVVSAVRLCLDRTVSYSDTVNPLTPTVAITCNLLCTALATMGRGL